MINNRQNGRRRGRGGGAGAPPRNGSNGSQDRGNRIDNRARGNAAQLLEKYKALARDAQMQGDRVNTEYYLQFADHYFRVLSESRSRFEDQQPRPRRDDFSVQSDEEYGDEGERGANEDQQQPAHEQGYAMQDREPQRDYGGNRAVDDRPREDRQRDDDQDDRRPRRGRQPRGERPYDAGGAPQSAAPAAPVAEPVQAAVVERAADEEPAPRRRGRPPKVQPAEQIEIDRLPPALSLQTPVNDGDDDGARPRTRTRRPRGESAAA